MPTAYTATDLYQEFGRPGSAGREALVRHIQRKTQNDGAALDIESTMWLRACQHKPGWDGRAPGKSWLYTVANNLVVDYIRGCQTAQRHGCVTVSPADPESEDGEQGAIDTDTPYEAVLHAEEAAKISVLMALIEPRYRAVLERRADGDTLSEIAEGMNLPLATVKARFYRGRAKLSDVMQELEGTW